MAKGPKSKVTVTPVYGSDAAIGTAGAIPTSNPRIALPKPLRNLFCGAYDSKGDLTSEDTMTTPPIADRILRTGSPLEKRFHDSRRCAVLCTPSVQQEDNGGTRKSGPVNVPNELEVLLESCNVAF